MFFCFSGIPYFCTLSLSFLSSCVLFMWFIGAESREKDSLVCVYMRTYALRSCLILVPILVGNHLAEPGMGGGVAALLKGF